MNACNENHAETCVSVPVSQRPPHEVPNWVIDTAQHCLVPVSSVHRYVALSYVWPDNKEHHICLEVEEMMQDNVSIDDELMQKYVFTQENMLTQDNTLMLNDKSWSDLQRPGFLNGEEALRALPPVIKYAIGLTSSLGERYLWVDRLCVNQKDGPIPDPEVMRMDKIYGGSYLTSIAAADNFAFARDVSSEWPTFDEWPYSEESVPEQIYLRFKCSDHHKRGWTYQEQVL